jgi:hypothetical protein
MPYSTEIDFSSSPDLTFATVQELGLVISIEEGPLMRVLHMSTPLHPRDFMRIVNQCLESMEKKAHSHLSKRQVVAIMRDDHIHVSPTPLTHEGGPVTDRCDASDCWCQNDRPDD